MEMHQEWGTREESDWGCCRRMGNEWGIQDVMRQSTWFVVSLSSSSLPASVCHLCPSQRLLSSHLILCFIHEYFYFFNSTCNCPCSAVYCFSYPFCLWLDCIPSVHWILLLRFLATTLSSSSLYVHQPLTPSSWAPLPYAASLLGSLHLCALQ